MAVPYTFCRDAVCNPSFQRFFLPLVGSDEPRPAESVNGMTALVIIGSGPSMERMRGE